MSFKHRLLRWTSPVLRHLVFSLPVKTPAGTFRVPIVQGTGFGVLDQLRRREEAWKEVIYRDLPETPNGLFIDIGANLGQTLIDLRMVAWDRPYLGFEPNPDCLHYMYKLIYKNEFRFVELVAVGIGASAGILSLYLPKGRSTDSTATLIGNLRPGRDYQVRQVPIIDGAQLTTLVGGRPIGLVKIDVEGAELEVITGLRDLLQQQRPPVLCEVLFTDPKASLEHSRERNQALESVLRDIDYRILQIRKSSDLQQVESLSPIETFPTDHYRPDNAALCDYLLLPRERADSLVARVPHPAR
jgi:FkbM family methyltransferase